MPELPDLTIYVERLRALLSGRILRECRIPGPFLLRTVTPRVDELLGRSLVAVERLGKQLVLGFQGDLYAVFHLMIAGRLRWRPPGAKLNAKIGLAAFGFDTGTLLLTEAGTKKRASLHLVRGRGELQSFDRGALEVLGAGLTEFSARLQAGNHTLKRALTDPRILSGIGNAYSDEILHRAQLSPVTLTSRLSAKELQRLWAATQETLKLWIEILRAEVGEGFPEKVTAFHPQMAVHGRFKEPCPICATRVQRIVYARNETNYCPNCQTAGRLLADRALSRLLKRDWPRSIDEL